MAVLSYLLSRFNWRNQKRNETRVVIKLCFRFVDLQVFLFIMIVFFFQIVWTSVVSSGTWKAEHREKHICEVR